MISTGITTAAESRMNSQAWREEDAQRVAEERSHVARLPELKLIHAARAGQLAIGIGHARDALLDLVGGHGGVGDPKGALAALDQEVGALHEDHAALARRPPRAAATSLPSGRSTQRK